MIVHQKVKAADAQLKRVTAAGRRSDKLAPGLGLPACAKDYEADGRPRARPARRRA
jgi:hypothetical protein